MAMSQIHDLDSPMEDGHVSQRHGGYSSDLKLHVSVPQRHGGCCPDPNVSVSHAHSSISLDDADMLKEHCH